MKNKWLQFADMGLISLNKAGESADGDSSSDDASTDADADKSAQSSDTSDGAGKDSPKTGEDGSDDLGDAGKKAIDRMKADKKAAEKRAREAEQERDRIKAEAEGKLAEWEADKKAREAADQRYRERLLNAEVRAAAKGLLANPDDALKFLNISEFDVDDDGEVDLKEIQTALDKLVEEKPYLAAVQDGKRFSGSGDAGTRKETGPVQLSKQDLEGMTHSQIVEAKKQGRLNDLLGIKST